MDNTLTLPLTISEKSSSSGKIESSDDALLYGPDFLLTLSVLSLISVIYSRKKE